MTICCSDQSAQKLLPVVSAILDPASRIFDISLHKFIFCRCHFVTEYTDSFISVKLRYIKRFIQNGIYLFIMFDCSYRHNKSISLFSNVIYPRKKFKYQKIFGFIPCLSLTHLFLIKSHPFPFPYLINPPV